eukprot:SM002553S08654  [mRNA]  locus=s2553:15:834:- [translate_table: standard]
MAFSVLHLRRRLNQWEPYVMCIGCIGIELRHQGGTAGSGNGGVRGELRWSLDYRDMAAPAIQTLADGGGFVLRPLHGRAAKAFREAAGGAAAVSSAAIVSKIVQAAGAHLGLTLLVETARLSVAQFIQSRAAGAVGLAEAPL